MLYLYILTTIYQKEFKQTIPFTVASRHKILENKFSQGGEKLLFGNYKI